MQLKSKVGEVGCGGCRWKMAKDERARVRVLFGVNMDGTESIPANSVARLDVATAFI